MTIFWAIGDTHLSFAKPRDFTRFGDKWANHAERIAHHWQQHVHPNDAVLISGDISWANSIKRVKPDLAWLAELPGRKILVRGNHDRWWTNIHTIRKKVLPKGFYALQGDSIVMDGVVICGAQGHITPNDPYYRPDPPQNRYERELATLEAALQSARTSRLNGQPLIIMMHYPPFTSDGNPTPYSDLIEQHAPAMCIYGHLHKPSEWAVAVNQERGGIHYRLVAADYLDMKPYKLLAEGN